MANKNIRGSKGRRSKSKASTQQNENLKREEIREGLLLKRECERRVFAQIEEFTEADAVESSQLDAIKDRLAPEHYEALVEERVLNGRCGLPTCNRRLGQLIKQKYRICLRTKQVLDLTERKNFCSAECYGASDAFKADLDPSPLWLRPSLRAEILAKDVEEKLVFNEKEARGVDDKTKEEERTGAFDDPKKRLEVIDEKTIEEKKLEVIDEETTAEEETLVVGETNTNMEDLD